MADQQQLDVNELVDAMSDEFGKNLNQVIRECALLRIQVAQANARDVQSKKTIVHMGKTINALEGQIETLTAPPSVVIEGDVV